ncbi:class I SAM-dependent methyltransferase [Candidatus Roizmanbacteria bacterium]|nr:class I SAM-dependent methyltransferase [Candidatus Roizmanbacteria bacterium]
MCRATDFKKVINFGRNPLVNSLIEEKDLDKTEPTFPLIVKQCQKCFLVQIVDPIDSHVIYRDVDYLYFSGDMPGLDKYFMDFALDDIRPRLKNPETGQDDISKFIVEIGSNDGTFLGIFKNWGFRTLGVDPASNVVVRALKNGIPTVSDFFSERLARSIVREYGKADIVGGANCIAHLNNLHDLMEGVNVLLKDDGTFWVECNYWGGMVKNKNYALIYHDHFSYFTLLNWVQFLEQFNMSVVDAHVTPAQGGSLRLFVKRGLNNPKTERCMKLLQEESENNLNSYETAKRYKKEVVKEAYKLGRLIQNLKSEGKTIAGYGAAAKGFSVLKLAGIDQRHIDYFVDDSPAKQGKYTPVSHIPVISRDEAEEKLPDYFFITAPNYKDVIIEKERDRRYAGKFVTVESQII